MTLPRVAGSISKTIRPGVAEAFSLWPRGTPAARRKSRDRTIRFEASSCTIVVTAIVWRGYGTVSSLNPLVAWRGMCAPFSRAAKRYDRRRRTALHQDWFLEVSRTGVAD